MSNFKNKLTVLATGLVMVFTSYTSTVSADAFEGLSMMRMGAWEVDFSGNANAFLISGDCEGEGSPVAAGLACGSNGTDYDYGDIRTGFLPSWFNFAASTNTPGGWKTGIHLSFQPGADDGATGNTLGSALGLNSSNFRQIFTTLSHENYGTFKIGRDLGVFGSNAILEDMTLLGVGTSARDIVGASSNSSLGRIGSGYIYADWKPQIQYTTPNMGGFSATFALVDPWGAGSLAGANDDDAYSTTNANRPQEEDTYGFEGKVNYAFDAGGGVSGHVWASFISQEVDWKNDCPTGLGVITNAADANTGACADPVDPDADQIVYATAGSSEVFNTESDDDSTAYDIGGKIVIDDFDFVAYYYDGEGLGTTDFLLDGYDRTGEQRDSDGYYMQARWRTPVGTLLGISYGESSLDETDYDTARRTAADSTYSLVDTNELFVIGAYHPVGEGLNLVLEYSKTDSEAHNGNEAEEDAIAVGAIMFF